MFGFDLAFVQVRQDLPLQPVRYLLGQRLVAQFAVKTQNRVAAPTERDREEVRGVHALQR